MVAEAAAAAVLPPQSPSRHFRAWGHRLCGIDGVQRCSGGDGLHQSILLPLFGSGPLWDRGGAAIRVRRLRTPLPPTELAVAPPAPRVREAAAAAVSALPLPHQAHGQPTASSRVASRRRVMFWRRLEAAASHTNPAPASHRDCRVGAERGRVTCGRVHLTLATTFFGLVGRITLDTAS